jgi:hypothetical protein
MEMELREIARLNHPSVTSLKARVNPVNLRPPRHQAETYQEIYHTRPLESSGKRAQLGYAEIG